MIPVKLDIDIANAIKAKHDRVLVIRDPAPKETASGVQLVDHKLNTGTILSVGTRCEEAQVGMRVIFSGGTEIEINKVKMLVLHEQDLWACQVVDDWYPFHDKVIIKPDAMPEIIKGLHVPETAGDAPKAGVVIAVGGDCEETKGGDRVLFGSFAGLHIKEMLIMREADLFASI